MRRRKPYSQGKCIPDNKTLDLLLNNQYSFEDRDTDINDEYCDIYRQWIQSTTLNSVAGLERFPNSEYSHGTTESFDKFYIRHKDKKLFVFAGEYSYHQYSVPVHSMDFSLLDSNSCVIISIPFADSGTEYCYHQLMRTCTEKNIPVLVDCCWFGLCGDMYFDFTYPCIEDVVFSMSKTFPVSRLRIGVRFSRDYQDGLSVYKRDSYLNFYNCRIAIDFLDNFEPDYMYKKYRKKQLEICKRLQVTPSPVVSLATGTGKQWEYLNRGGPFNRLCLSDPLSEV